MRVGNSQPEPNSLIAFRNFSEEPKSPGIWEPDEGDSSASASASASASESASAPRDSLASLYRPPFHLMFQGSFEQAKTTSSSQDKWLLVNLQSTTEFSSHMVTLYYFLFFMDVFKTLPLMIVTSRGAQSHFWLGFRSIFCRFNFCFG
jgi:hypothetical protein